MIRFIIKSFIFKRLVAALAIFIVLIIISSGLFDRIWNSENCIALIDLHNVYEPPSEYNNVRKINLLFIEPDKLCIEGNWKLRLIGSSKSFDYYDTAKIQFPNDDYDFVNKIYFQLEGSKNKDSIFFVVSKTGEKNVYFNQIFLSSVQVNNINSTEKITSEFRLDNSKFVDKTVLENNDKLINRVFAYFNSNRDKLKLGDCRMNSNAFIEICNNFNLPCRLIYLQGGNLGIAGYRSEIGYPSHVVCEIYSSRIQSWYIVDPTYGLRFSDMGAESFLSAAEISNNFYFMKEKWMVQDSVLSTKRNRLGRDYFKYYENVYYETGYMPNYILKKVLDKLYGKFGYSYFLYANNTSFIKNGKNYMMLKSLMYLFLIIILVNYFIIVMTGRLIKVKKPQKTLTA